LDLFSAGAKQFERIAFMQIILFLRDEDNIPSTLESKWFSVTRNFAATLFLTQIIFIQTEM